MEKQRKMRYAEKYGIERSKEYEGRVYYTINNDIYSCDTDGKNERLLSRMPSYESIYGTAQPKDYYDIAPHSLQVAGGYLYYWCGSGYFQSGKQYMSGPLMRVSVEGGTTEKLMEELRDPYYALYDGGKVYVYYKIYNRQKEKYEGMYYDLESKQSYSTQQIVALPDTIVFDGPYAKAYKGSSGVIQTIASPEDYAEYFVGGLGFTYSWDYYYGGTLLAGVSDYVQIENMMYFKICVEKYSDGIDVRDLYTIQISALIAKDLETGECRVLSTYRQPTP